MVDLSALPVEKNMQYYLDEMHRNGVMQFSDDFEAGSISFLEIGQIHRNRVREDREFFAKKKAESYAWKNRYKYNRVIGTNRPANFSKKTCKLAS